jgi:DNA-binding response OmpR family regulator
MKVLIVEDDLLMQANIRQQLIKEDYEVATANNGTEAFNMLSTYEPDIVITDIMMPYTSGLELIGLIRSQKKQPLPILVLSAIDEESTVLEALSMGADDFLIKPCRPADLSTRIKRLLKIA